MRGSGEGGDSMGVYKVGGEWVGFLGSVFTRRGIVYHWLYWVFIGVLLVRLIIGRVYRRFGLVLLGLVVSVYHWGTWVRRETGHWWRRGARDGCVHAVLVYDACPSLPPTQQGVAPSPSPSPLPLTHFCYFVGGRRLHAMNVLTLLTITVSYCPHSLLGYLFIGLFLLMWNITIVGVLIYLVVYNSPFNHIYQYFYSTVYSIPNHYSIRK